MTRREAVKGAAGAALMVFGGALAFEGTSDLLLALELGREPWIADVRKGHGPIYTASGELVLLPNAYNEKPAPVLTYELVCELDGKPCPCMYANEAAGYVLAWEDKTFQRLKKETGQVRLRVEQRTTVGA